MIRVEISQYEAVTFEGNGFMWIAYCLNKLKKHGIPIKKMLCFNGVINEKLISFKDKSTGSIIYEWYE